MREWANIRAVLGEPNSIISENKELSETLNDISVDFVVNFNAKIKLLISAKLLI